MINYWWLVLFFLKSSVSVFFLCCNSEVRRVLFSLLRRLEQYWTCKIWDLVCRILNSFQSYCLNMQNWEFPSFPSLKKSKLGKPARHANASWQTASKHEFHVRTATVQQKPFPRDRSTPWSFGLRQPPPPGCASLHGSVSPVLQEDSVPGGEYLMHHLWEIPADI